MHADKREKVIKGRGIINKGVVMGLLARHTKKNPVSKVVARHVASTGRHDLLPHIHQHIPHGAEIHSDTHSAYDRLHTAWEHKVVDHAECYVKDGVHTNGLENFWSLLKRTLKGTYVHCAPFHLYRYLDEQTYRFNERQNEDGDKGRFLDVLRTTAGRRLTWMG